jgi:hypothetical protein
MSGQASAGASQNRPSTATSRRKHDSKPQGVKPKQPDIINSVKHITSKDMQ